MSSVGSPPQLRYAVLRHSGVDAPHFDFLFEIVPGSSLTTFRIIDWPPRLEQEAVKLRDHRAFYLAYEGPVPGDRGRVDRVADGLASIERTAGGFRVRLSSPAMDIELRETSPDQWVMSAQ